jgi:NitT/TauT family transport system substrate-binding protein
MRILAGLAAISVVAVGAWRAGSGKRPPERLVVASVRQPATSLFFVAQAAGCLEGEKLEVDERTFDLGRDALVLLRHGKADVAIAYETPVLRAAFADEHLRVLTSLHTSTENTRLVTRRDAGITTFRDLRGRRLAAARGTNADFFVETILRFGGVPRPEVTIVDLAPQDAVEALLARRVDAIALSDPAAHRAERALGNDAWVLTTDLYVEFSLLATRDDVVRSRPEALKALLRALECGARAAESDPELALSRIRARFADEHEQDLRAQVRRVTWSLGLDHLLLHVLRRERDWLRSSGHTSGAIPDLSRLIERAPLEDVVPAAVLLPPGGSGP